MSSPRKDVASSSARAEKPGIPAVPSAIAPPDNLRPKRSAIAYYVQTPVAMLLDPGLSSEAKVLASILLHYDGPRGCFPGTATLAKDLNASLKTIYRLLEELERYKFIARRRVGRRNHYQLTPSYIPPVRPDSFEATGRLRAMNVARVRPARRLSLHREAAPLELGLTDQVVKPPPSDIEAARVERKRRKDGTRSSKYVPPVGPIVGISEGAGAEYIPPVGPIAAEREFESSGYVPPMGLIGASEAHNVVENVPSVGPIPVPPVGPNDENTSHGWDLDKTKNHSLSKTKEQQSTPESSPGEAAVVVVQAKAGEERIAAASAFLAPTLLDIQRRVDASYAPKLAGEVAAKLIAAATEELDDLDLVVQRILQATKLDRIQKHPNPIGALMHGIVGVDGIGRYLLAAPPTTSTSSKGRSGTPAPARDMRPPLERISPGLRDALLERIRDNRLEPRWCSENGINSGMIEAARVIADQRRAAEGSLSPRCDAFALNDPQAYRARLGEILETLPELAGFPKSLESIIWLGRCRAKLEIELFEASSN